MNNIESSIPKLINLVKIVEPTLKDKGKAMMIVESLGSKNKKKKKTTKPNRGVAKKKAKETTTKGTCFHCHKDGHWRRNRKAYLESLKKKALDAPFTSGMFVIEVNTICNSNLWVFDTCCGSHIYTDVHGLKNNRQLNKGESNLQVGNGARVIALATRTYVLTLPSGLILNLDDYYYIPPLTKNIILVSYLNKNGFYLHFKNNSCSIMLNDILYASVTLCNDIYILDMFNPILTVHDNKRQKKDNLKLSYLCHCYLGI